MAAAAVAIDETIASVAAPPVVVMAGTAEGTAEVVVEVKAEDIKESDRNLCCCCC